MIQSKVVDAYLKAFSSSMLSQSYNPVDFIIVKLLISAQLKKWMLFLNEEWKVWKRLGLANSIWLVHS